MIHSSLITNELWILITQKKPGCCQIHSFLLFFKCNVTYSCFFCQMNNISFWRYGGKYIKHNLIKFYFFQKIDGNTSLIFIALYTILCYDVQKVKYKFFYTEVVQSCLAYGCCHWILNSHYPTFRWSASHSNM